MYDNRGYASSNEKNIYENEIQIYAIYMKMMPNKTPCMQKKNKKRSI